MVRKNLFFFYQIDKNYLSAIFEPYRRQRIMFGNLAKYFQITREFCTVDVAHSKFDTFFRLFVSKFVEISNIRLVLIVRTSRLIRWKLETVALS